MAEDTSTDRAATWLRDDQVQRLRDACYDDRFDASRWRRNDAIVALLYDTGFRVGELVRLDVEDLDLDARSVTHPDTPARQPETGPWTVALDQHPLLGTTRALRSYLADRDGEDGPLFPSREGGRLTTKAVRDAVNKAAAIAGVRPWTPDGRGDPTGVSPQTLRHSTAWRLLHVEDRPLSAVRDRLGHADLATTRALYGHIAPRSAGPGTVPAREGSAADQQARASGDVARDIGADDATDAALRTLADHADHPANERLLGSFPDVMYVFDRDGQMWWWNDRLGDVTGYTDAEIAEMYALELVPDDEVGAVSESIARVVNEGRVEQIESHLVTKAGGEIPYEFNGAPITDDDGTVMGVVGAGRNISARRQAERAAERERERYALFVEAVQEYAMFLLDPDGTITSWNRGAERIKGYSTREIVGRHLSVLYPEEAVERGRPETLLETAASEGHVEDEGWRVRKDGTRFWANVTITALYDDGELAGYAKVTRDMTERRQRERAIERQRDELERVNRINAVIRDIDRTLVAADDRAEIERRVCERLATVDVCAAAWIGDARSADRPFAVRAGDGMDEDAFETVVAAMNETPTRDDAEAAGADDGLIDEEGATDSPTPDGGCRWPTRQAHRTGSVQTDWSLLEEPIPEDARAPLADADCRGAVAVPLVHREASYGVLTLYVDDPGSVGERQVGVLAELGETIGHAIAATERKAALESDSAVAVTLALSESRSGFERVADALDATVTLSGVAQRGDGGHLCYATVEDASEDDVETLPDRIEALDHVRVLRDEGDEVLCELGLSDPAIVTTVAGLGGTMTGLTSDGARTEIEVELPPSVAVSGLVEALESSADAVRLERRRRVDRSVRTERRFGAAVEDRLTTKQREALEAAYLAGFFQRPRLSTGEQVAESLGVSASTFHQHNRIGLQKLLEVLLEPREIDAG